MLPRCKLEGMDIFKKLLFLGDGKTGLSKKNPKPHVFASKHKIDQLESTNQSTVLDDSVSFKESHPTDIWQHFDIVSALQRLSLASSAL